MPHGRNPLASCPLSAVSLSLSLSLSDVVNCYVSYSADAGLNVEQSETRMVKAVRILLILRLSPQGASVCMPVTLATASPVEMGGFNKSRPSV